MSTFESTFICSPELPTEKIDELVEKVKKTIEAAGGTIALTQQLGRKRLAYPIKKFREGNYVYLEIAGPGQMVASLENLYKVNDTVIRYLTIKVEKKKAVRPVVQPVVPPAVAPQTPATPAPEAPQSASEEVK
jgi:small subunit ribosomal protein S6